MDNLGEHIMNDYDCPILMMADILFCIPSVSVSHSLSVVHECTNTCVFVSGLASKKVEHEEVNCTQLCYEHDWSNNMYSLNVYCMSS